MYYYNLRVAGSRFMKPLVTPRSHKVGLSKAGGGYIGFRAERLGGILGNLGVYRDYKRILWVLIWNSTTFEKTLYEDVKESEFRYGHEYERTRACRRRESLGDMKGLLRGIRTQKKDTRRLG